MVIIFVTFVSHLIYWLIALVLVYQAWYLIVKELQLLVYLITTVNSVKLEYYKTMYVMIVVIIFLIALSVWIKVKQIKI